MVPVMIFKLSNGTLSAFYHTNIELSCSGMDAHVLNFVYENSNNNNSNNDNNNNNFNGK